jgi:hypothetical protein
VSARKEWLRITHGASGTTATVTIVEDNLSVKWSVKTFTNKIKAGIKEARVQGNRAMDELQEVSDHD